MKITNRLSVFSNYYHIIRVATERERKKGRRATKPHPSNGDRREGVQRSEQSSPLVLPQQTKKGSQQIEVVSVISGLLLSNRRCLELYSI
jgi:hypothetical protein